VFEEKEKNADAPIVLRCARGGAGGGDSGGRCSGLPFRWKYGLDGRLDLVHGKVVLLHHSNEERRSWARHVGEWPRIKIKRWKLPVATSI
jgi:hypothetical protein